jgi:uncharacterized membrane protein
MVNTSQNNPDAPPAEPRDSRAAGPSATAARALSVKVERTETRPAPPPAETRAGTRTDEPHVPAQPFTERIPEHVAGMLAYLLGWVSGLIFLLVDRRPFVRYHAAQSVAVFAILSGLLLIFGDFFLATFLPGAAGFFLAVRRVLELCWLAAAVVLMLKAAAGERYRVPRVAAIADRAAHSGE